MPPPTRAKSAMLSAPSEKPVSTSSARSISKPLGEAPSTKKP
jgi:hypothetical protein